MTEFVTEGGAKVVINEGAFEDALELKRVVFLAALRTGLKLTDLMDKEDLENVDKVVSAALSIDSDKEVYNALWPCLLKCTYNGQKITKATFDEKKARNDYALIAFKCVWENIEPFTNGLRLAWGMFRSPAESLSQE